jgi:hypothetical protein
MILSFIIRFTSKEICMSKLFQVYGLGQALIPVLPPPIKFQTPPTSTQTNYSVGQMVYVGDSGDVTFYLYEGDGVWLNLSASVGSVSSVTGSNGVDASPTTGNVIVSGINATTVSVGVASFNALDFTVDPSGEVSLIGTTPNSYVNVTSADSPYTALSTDYFISVDSTGGPVTIILPASTSLNRQFIIKDRLGNASINNITVSAGGVTTIDQSTANVFTDNFDSLEVLFHSGTPNNYEVF